MRFQIFNMQMLTCILIYCQILTSQPLFRQRLWVASPVRFTTITMGPQAKREASRRDTGWGDTLSQLWGSDALGRDGGGVQGGYTHLQQL